MIKRSLVRVTKPLDDTFEFSVHTIFFGADQSSPNQIKEPNSTQFGRRTDWRAKNLGLIPSFALTSQLLILVPSFLLLKLIKQCGLQVEPTLLLSPVLNRD